jgi:hypothetical protein
MKILDQKSGTPMPESIIGMIPGLHSVQSSSLAFSQVWPDRVLHGSGP